MEMPNTFGLHAETSRAKTIAQVFIGNFRGIENCSSRLVSDLLQTAAMRIQVSASAYRLLQVIHCRIQRASPKFLKFLFFKFPTHFWPFSLRKTRGDSYRPGTAIRIIIFRLQKLELINQSQLIHSEPKCR